MLKILLIIMSVFISIRSFSTTLLPLPIPEQLKNSDGIIHGTFSSKKYKRMHGKVITEAIFKVSKSIGIQNNSIINKNNFKVVFPGGIWQGQNYQTIGAPSFAPNEEVVLILKNTKYGLTVKGQSLGKYNLIRKGPFVFLSNAAFPNHALLGKIELKKFSTYASSYFTNEDFIFNSVKTSRNNTKVNPDLFIQKTQFSDKSNKRQPASISSSEHPNEVENDNSLFWAAVLFALFGVISTISSKRFLRK